MITDKDTEIKWLKEDRDAWKKSSDEFEGMYNRQKLKNQNYEAKSDNEKVSYWRNKYWNLAKENKP